MDPVATKLPWTNDGRSENISIKLGQYASNLGHCDLIFGTHGGHTIGDKKALYTPIMW